MREEWSNGEGVLFAEAAAVEGVGMEEAVELCAVLVLVEVVLEEE